MALSCVVALAFQIFLFVSDVENRHPILVLAFAIAQLFATWIIIQRVFRASLRRAVLAWLPTLAGVAISFEFVWFVLNPYVLETYLMPTNGMAPTLLGEHFDARCPKCGGTMIVTA